jgi:CRISPR/Cas system-associated protein Csm6
MSNESKIESKIDSNEVPQLVPLLSNDEQLYIRSAFGETKYLPATEAIEQFMSDEGYRLTFEFANGMKVVIRRDSSKPPIDANIYYESATFECKVTISGEVLIFPFSPSDIE